MLFVPHILQTGALAIGIYTLTKVRSIYLWLVVCVLALTVSNENIVVPWLGSIHSKTVTKDVAYNMFSLFDIFIWLFIFFSFFKRDIVSRVLIILSVCIFLYSCADIFFFTGISKLHINSMMVYDMYMVLLGTRFLYIALRTEYYEPMNDFRFWLSAAVIVYHSLLFLNFITLWMPDEYWNSSRANDTWFVVSLSAQMFYYLLLSIAFLSCIRFKSMPTSFLP